MVQRFLFKRRNRLEEEEGNKQRASTGERGREIVLTEDGRRGTQVNSESGSDEGQV